MERLEIGHDLSRVPAAKGVLLSEGLVRSPLQAVESVHSLLLGSDSLVGCPV